MINLSVVVVMPDGVEVQAGQIAITDPDSQGVCKGQFRYLSEYLARSDAFPLDPAHLPLSNKTYTSQRTDGIFSVFEDSLPDSWGRRLLIRHHNLPRSKQNLANLLVVAGNNTLGAVRFRNKEKHSFSSPALVGDLSVLLQQAEMYENHPDCDNQLLRQLLMAGSSPGGARPKVLVKDELSSYIAKFPAVTDVYDVVGLEAVCMKMALDAGLNVAETELKSIGSKKVLLVKRFDVTENGGYNHMISMQTLLNVHGYYHSSYKDLAEMLRRWSERCDSDLKMLYRQLVFNVMIGNTDDHLKNFMMMHTDSGWQLSPAYDLVPDIGRMREHTLMFNNSNYPPIDIDELIKLGKLFNLASSERTREIIEQCGVALKKADNYLQENYVEDETVKLFTNDFNQKLKKYGLL